MSDIHDDDVWKVIDAYFDAPQHKLASCQTDSFDSFIERRLPLILDTVGKIKVETEDAQILVSFTNPRLLKPMYKDQHGKAKKLWPAYALSQNYSYVGDLMTDINYTAINGKQSIFKNKIIGSIPIMIGSRWCTTYEKTTKKLLKHNEPLKNPGGYFIVRPKSEDGVSNEKTIIIHERAAHDKVTILRRGSNSKTKVFYYASVMSHDVKTLFRQTTTMIGFDNPKNKGLYVILPWHESKLIPIGMVFKALGVTDLDEIRKMIFGENWKKDPDLHFVSEALEFSYECQTTERALHYIGTKCKIFEKPKAAVDDGEGAEDGEVDEGNGDGEEGGNADIDLIDYDEVDEEVDEGDEGVDFVEDEEIEVDEDEEAAAAELIAKSKNLPEIILARKILAHDLFPHLGEGNDSDSFLKKARYLAYALKKLIKTFTEKYPPERRDNYGNKRCISAGGRLGHQFMTSLKRFCGEIFMSISKGVKNKGHINIAGWTTRTSTITNHMISGVSSNSWLFRIVGTSKGPKGLSQAYDNYSRLASITQVRKLRVPICDSGKVVGPRDLSGDHFGNLCPETPEGKQSGLVKPTALSCSITIESDPDPVKNIISDYLAHQNYGVGSNLPSSEMPSEAYDWTLIFVNGDLIGYTNKPVRLVNALRKLRRNGLLDRYISISYHDIIKEIQVLTDAGRLTRPLLIVEKGKLVLTSKLLSTSSSVSWEDLLKAGAVEYLDVTEQDQAELIAGYPSDLEANPHLKYSHCEIHPSLMFGAGIAMIPKPDHNQAPRNVYQAQMGRQAIGVPFTNFGQRYHGSFNVLHYPEKPIVTTRLAEKIGHSEFPNGYNVIAAIMCAPFNEEDSIEISQSSIDLGMFRDTHVINYEMREKTVKGEKFGIPTFVEGAPLTTKKGNFRFVTYLGYAEIGSMVEKGDVLLCKLTTTSLANEVEENKVVTEEVEIYKEPFPGRVHSIKEGKDSDGYSFYRLQVHEIRTPIVGDKFAAPHAQKGVIGRKTRKEDLPWTGLSGLTPDVVINALAFPSRMTLALMIEAIFGIIVSSGHVLGEYTVDEVWSDERRNLTNELSSEFKQKYMIGDQVDGTPFRKLDLEDLDRELTRLGISMGEQECYDGVTGELISTKVMFAPIYYQRLKHVVQDKFHARSTGALNSQTRQPPEGRGHDGGLKFGVMEADSSNAGGTAYFTKDRLMDSSDATRAFFCGDCGSAAYKSKLSQTQLCRVCGSYKIEELQIPYGTKLMCQELEALNIVAKIIPAKKQ